MEGTCHLCGAIGELSFEHIPPKNAFNKGPSKLCKDGNFIKSLLTTDMENIKTRVYQKGSGEYTLCKNCNNNTGAWYGNAYIDWVYQAAAILKYTKNKSNALESEAGMAEWR